MKLKKRLVVLVIFMILSCSINLSFCEVEDYPRVISLFIYWISFSNGGNFSCRNVTTTIGISHFSECGCIYQF